MPTDNKSLRIRQRSPEQFTKFRTKVITEGISAVIGFRKDGGSEVQSFVFDKDKFNLQSAKNWVKDHNSKIKEHFSVPFLKAIENVVVYNGDPKNMTSATINTVTANPTLPESKPEEKPQPTEAKLSLPDEQLESLFDIKHSANGKVDRSKVLSHLDSLKKMEPFYEKKAFSKMQSFLMGKMRECHQEFLTDKGFNLLEGETSLVADNFEIDSVLKESIQESPSSVNGSSVKKAKVVLIKSGWSKNGNHYSPASLRNSVNLFEGLPIYPNHIDGERKVEDKVGFYAGVEYVGDDNEGELRAIANIFESEKKMWDLIKEQHNHPNAKICGLSINAFGKGRVQEELGTGKKKRFVDQITHAVSTDIVDNPSAGGKVLELLESVKNELTSVNSSIEDVSGEESMDEKTLREKHADLVKAIEDSAKSFALKEADEKSAKCPHCGKDYPVKESVEHHGLHMKELGDKLQESEKALEQFKGEIAKATLEKAVHTKLSEAELKGLPQKTKERLALSLIQLGDEKREGDKPSNWDSAIKEELDYVKQVRGSDVTLDLGSDKTDPKSGEVKLSEKQQRELAKDIARNL